MGLNAGDVQLNADCALKDLPNWDSLAILTTISMIDMEYGVTVSGADLRDCATVTDLFNLGQQRKA